MTRAIALLSILALVPFSIDLSCRDTPVPPVVNADCDDGTAIVDEPVCLSGSVVVDTGCPPFQYIWSQLTGPPGILEQQSPDSPTATFTPLVPGVCILRLNVIDDCGNSDHDKCVISVPSGIPECCEFIDPVTGQLLDPSGTGFEELCAVECDQVSNQNTIMLRVYQCEPYDSKIQGNGYDCCYPYQAVPVANVRVDWFLERIYGGDMGDLDPPCDRIVGEIVAADDERGDSGQRDEDFATTYTDADGTTWIVIHSRYEGITPITAVVRYVDDEGVLQDFKCCFIKIWTCLEIVCLESTSIPANSVVIDPGQELENWHQFTFQVNNLCTGLPECDQDIDVFLDTTTGPDAYLEQAPALSEPCAETYQMADSSDACAVLENTIADGLGPFPADIRTLVSFTAPSDQNGQVPVRVRLQPTAESIVDSEDTITCILTDDVDLGQADCPPQPPLGTTADYRSRVCASLSLECLPTEVEVECLTDCCEKDWTCVPALVTTKVDTNDPIWADSTQKFIFDLRNTGTLNLTDVSVNDTVETLGAYDPLPNPINATVAVVVPTGIGVTRQRFTDRNAQITLDELVPTQRAIIAFNMDGNPANVGSPFSLHEDAAIINCNELDPFDVGEMTTVLPSRIPGPGLSFDSLGGNGYEIVTRGGGTTGMLLRIAADPSEDLAELVVRVELDPEIVINGNATFDTLVGGEYTVPPTIDQVPADSRIFEVIWNVASPFEAGFSDVVVAFDIEESAAAGIIVDTASLITVTATSTSEAEDTSEILPIAVE